MFLCGSGLISKVRHKASELSIAASLLAAVTLLARYLLARTAVASSTRLGP